MEPSEIKKLWEVCCRYARKRGYSQFADDFAQEAVFARIRGRKASLDQLLTDFLRKEYGDSRVRRQPKWTSRRADRFAHVSLDDKIGQSEMSYGDIIASPERDTRLDTDDQRIGLSLDRREQVVYELAKSISQVDISEIYGVTPSRIWQILKGAERKLSKEATVNKFYDIYSDIDETSVLSVNWVAI